jgi:hypothetical protein
METKVTADRLHQRPLEIYRALGANHLPVDHPVQVIIPNYLTSNDYSPKNG